MATITLPVFSFRRLPTPFESQNETGKQNAIAVASVRDVPDLSSWRKVNPREVNPNNHVAKAIGQSLADNPDFFFINRGLVLTVNGYDFDQKKGLLHLHLEDPEVHGLLDGGHTYQMIVNDRERLSSADDETVLDQYVKIEILTGFPPAEAITIVEGRNTSNQVKEKSIANLKKAFATLKQVIEGTRYADKVAYVENAEGTIDIRELISFLYIFVHLDPKIQPIYAYQSKGACLDDFLDDFENHGGQKYKPVYSIACDIFELWDQIHFQLPDLYKKSRVDGRFGRLSGVASGTTNREKLAELPFIGSDSPFKIPAAMKYPILASFRAFVEKNPETGDYQWGMNPFEMLTTELGEQMAEQVGASIRETRNPSKSGRDRSLWKNCYQAARIAYLELRQS